MEKQKPAIAHIRQDALGRWHEHGLDAHLTSVAEMAAQFSRPFGGDGWARLAGLWHDLGKCRPGFQHYIRQVNDPDAHIEGRIAGPEKTHSAAGALHALDILKRQHGRAGEIAARVLAYVIAGHHAGLDDWHEGLKARLDGENAKREHAEAIAAASVRLLGPDAFAPDLRQVPGSATAPGAFALWVRMLFSCLVDADFLDTEAFMDGCRASARGAFPTLEEMRVAYEAHMAGFAPDTPVKAIRADILRQCRRKAKLPPGIFTLTVPTGGGKTLASLGFAIDHALAHAKQRIVYAIPYTSIIEQTADVFRAVFASLGREVVVEHHGQAESDPRQETAASRLACENWDAPLVVTTNVQLFESLFAARTSRCRKLHNLVGSVIVLDEAQQLPPEFLQPILDVLNLLVAHYGVTVVVCTATQPALASTAYFDASRNLRGLDRTTEIVEDPDALYAALKRVAVRLPADLGAATQWPSLAQDLSRRDCVLAVVNTRKAARELHRLMPKGTLHLSALMCGAHRAEVIDAIKRRLAARREGRDREPLRVVSTQLVEAGVDLDFPVVYRALAGLDSIAQAAGRCNREGRLDGLGEVVVFIPPESPPPGLPRQGAQAFVSVLHGCANDPLDRALFERYFRQLYAAVDLDREHIAALLTDGVRDRDQPLAVAFRTAAERFRLIDDDHAPVIAFHRGPHGTDTTVDALLGKLEKDGPARWLMRSLQRYTVSIPQREAERMLASADLRLVPACPGLYAQVSDLQYDAALGLLLDSDRLAPDRLML